MFFTSIRRNPKLFRVEIAYPIRKVIQEYDDFYFRLTSVQEIDTTHKKIIAEIGELTYDYLVIATGAKTNFFVNNLSCCDGSSE